jgi:hypothetical protein
VVLALAREVYGDGQLVIDADGPTASVSRVGKELYTVSSFEGEEPIAAIERYLAKR